MMPEKRNRTNHNPLYPADPFRTRGGQDEPPSVEAVAIGIINDPVLLREVIRRLLWTDPGLFDEIRQEMSERRDGIVAACKNGTFGRDYIARDAAPFTGKEI